MDRSINRKKKYLLRNNIYSEKKRKLPLDLKKNTWDLSMSWIVKILLRDLAISKNFTGSKFFTSGDVYKAHTSIFFIKQ